MSEKESGADGIGGDELEARIQQLEATAHEAHQHLHEKIMRLERENADVNERLDIQTAEVAELEEQLTDAHAELERLEEEVQRLRSLAEE